MEIVVPPEDDLEIRRVRLINHSDRPRRLLVVSYAEVVLASQDSDRRHPAFSKLFVESELLREVEENDEAHFRYVPEEGETREASDVELPAFMLTRLEQLSLLAGVRRLAFCHRGQEILAQAGQRRVLTPTTRDSFVDLAVGFRRTASLSAKRMGIGAFEEAELVWEGGRILAAAAGPTIMLLETDPVSRLATIAAEARNFIAGCIIATKGGAP